MDEILRHVLAQKAQLDGLRPLSADTLRALQKHYDVELTFTSNAIEGNTRTNRETAEVIEHGISVGGKSLRDHLEAVDHYKAVQWMRKIAGQEVPIGEEVVSELHRRIVARSQPEIAGIYSRLPRRVAGSAVTFPNPLRIPKSMTTLDSWLEHTPAEPAAAFEAHFRLSAIHPLPMATAERPGS